METVSRSRGLEITVSRQREVRFFAVVFDTPSRQWTEYNDLWFMFRPGGVRFMRFGAFNPKANGAGWIKVYQRYDRSFDTKSVDHRGHSESP